MKMKSDYEFELNEDQKSYSLTNYYGDDANLIVPLKHEGLFVTKIIFHGDFEDNIKTLNISSAIRSISNLHMLDNLERIEVDSDNLFYSSLNGVLFNKDQSVLIRYCNNFKETEYRVPEGVLELAYESFCNVTTLKKVYISKSVEIIGDNSFDGAENLEEVTFSDQSQLKVIGKAAFLGAYNLKDIKIPRYVEIIDSFAFCKATKLERVKFSEYANLKKIGMYAFYKAKELEYIELPRNLKHLDGYSFDRCNNLKTVAFRYDTKLNYLHRDAFQTSFMPRNMHVPNNFEAVECCDGWSYYFVLNDENKTTKFIDGVEFSHDFKILLKYPEDKEDIYYEVPFMVEVIKKDAFGSAKKLEVITFEKNSKLREIQNGAFYFVKSLRKIDLPKSLEVIGDFAFSNTELEKVSFEKDSNLRFIGSFAFSKTQIKEIIIPKNVLIIDFLAFYKNNNLMNIDFEKGSHLRKIKRSFEMNKNCKKIVIPKNVRILDGAFSECKKLEEVRFENNSKLNIIGQETFYKNINLKKMIFPKKLKIISRNIFNEAINLEEVIFEDGSLIESIDEKTFFGASKLKNIKIETPNNANYQKRSSYNTKDGILYYNNDEIIKYPEGREDAKFIVPKDIKIIRDFAFYSTKFLKEIIFEPNIELKEIGLECFKNSKQLESIIIPKSVEVIGKEAFSNINTLKNVKFEKDSKATVIPRKAFSSIDGSKDFVIPRSIQKIEELAFSNIKNLERIIFEDKSRLNLIKEYAFFENNNLKSFCVIKESKIVDYGDIHRHAELPAQTTEKVANYSLLNGILYKDNMKVLVKYPEAKKGSSHELIKSVETIDSYAFYNAKNLKEIVFSKNTQLKEIGICSFGGNCGLTTINIPSGVDVIYISTFYNTPNLAQINVEKDNKKFTSCDGVLYYKDKETVLKYPEGKPDQVFELNDYVHTIFQEAFALNKHLEQLNISTYSQLKYIGHHALYGAEKLKSFTISNRLEEIGKFAFDKTVNLEEFYCENKYHKNFAVIDGVLFDNEIIHLYKYPHNKKESGYIVPETVNKIVDKEFLEAKNLKRVVTKSYLIGYSDRQKYKNKIAYYQNN